MVEVESSVSPATRFLASDRYESFVVQQAVRYPFFSFEYFVKLLYAHRSAICFLPP